MLILLLLFIIFVKCGPHHVQYMITWMGVTWHKINKTKMETNFAVRENLQKSKRAKGQNCKIGELSVKSNTDIDKFCRSVSPTPAPGIYRHLGGRFVIKFVVFTLNWLACCWISHIWNTFIMCKTQLFSAECFIKTPDSIYTSIE